MKKKGKQEGTGCGIREYLKRAGPKGPAREQLTFLSHNTAPLQVIIFSCS